MNADASRAVQTRPRKRRARRRILISPATPTAVSVILNTSSGMGHPRSVVEALRTRFREHGIEAEVLIADNGNDVPALARGAARQGGVVVAAGGDGTVSTVADAVRRTGAVLGVIPLGTLNHFARDMGIPLEAAEAIRTIAAGHRVQVDVGEVNGASFINNSSLGLYPKIVRGREWQQRRLRRPKRTAMLWAILATLRRAPLLNLQLEVGGGQQACTSPFVFIGNNDYTMKGFHIGKRARLDGGKLSIYTTTRRTAGGLFMLALRALFGTLRQAEDFNETHARTLRVETPRRHLYVATDGEVAVMQTPLEYSILPRSLTVIAPGGP
jgi:diacylglycerol kinase family enzyme